MCLLISPAGLALSQRRTDRWNQPPPTLRMDSMQFEGKEFYPELRATDKTIEL